MEEFEKAYQSLLKARERAKLNYQKNKEAILLKRKEYRDKKLEGTERKPVGRPKKDASLI